MVERPSGTVTFLFTDIEGSTRLWEHRREDMKVALERHDSLVRAAIAQSDGFVFAATGDGFAAAFRTPDDAIAAAHETQRAIAREDFAGGLAIRVRIGIHTGQAAEREDDYFGPAVNRAARLMSGAHGGQVVVSSAVRSMAENPSWRWLDLGEHRLKDLATDERVHQLLAPDLEIEFPALRTLDTLPGNLPRQLTRFLGRSEEVAELRATVIDAPLTTLTGVGGVGKTRLALEVAAAAQTEFPDGSWLVEFAQVTDPDMVPSALRTAIGLQGVETVDAIAGALRTRKLLLVLDNCEHLIASAASVATRILQAAPAVRILATSREGLGIRGEQLRLVTSLPVTRDGVDDGAMQLFEDRASAVRADFVIDDESAATVAELCERLDGIPLAIELAAARVRVLSPSEILARIDERFRLLTGRDRKALERHQTLRGTVDWSYDLLSPLERTALQRLSAFVGGFDLVAAEAVVAGGEIDESEVLDLLLLLVDKSLLIADRDHDETRYRLLETIRQYAEEKLAESGDAAATRRRHATYFRDLAATASEQMCGPDEVSAIATVRREIANLQTAVSWAADNGGTDLAMNTVASFARPFFTIGTAEAALASIALTADGAGDHPAFADVAAVGCWSGYLLGDREKVRSHADMLRAASDRLTPTQRRIVALSSGIVEVRTEWMLDELRAVVDEALHARDDYVAAGTLANCAFAANLGFDLPLALPFARDAVAAADRNGCPGMIAIANWNLGFALQYDDPDAARSAFEIAAHTSRGSAHIIAGLSRSLLGVVLARAGDTTESAIRSLEGVRLFIAVGDVANLSAATANAGLVLAYAGHADAAVVVHASRPVFGSAPAIAHFVEECLAIAERKGIPSAAPLTDDVVELARIAERALLDLIDADDR